MISTRLRILFVDDEESILRSTKRLFRRNRGKWDLLFASSGETALKVLDSGPVDIVVSDQRMPRMTGAELLSIVAKQHPDTGRILLTGYSTESALLDALGPAHQLLQKPCDGETLERVLGHFQSLRLSITSDGCRNTVMGVQRLPLSTETEARLELADGDVKATAAALARDPAASLKVLQFANSAFFPHLGEVLDPETAVHSLGIDTIRTMRRIGLLGSFHGSGETCRAIDTLAERSASVAELAGEMAADLGLPYAEGYLAGLAHNIGALIFSSRCVGYRARLEAGIAQGETVPCESCGTPIDQAAESLLLLWNLPARVATAVRYQSCPSDAPVDDARLLTALHAARALASTAAIDPLEREARPDRDFIALHDRVEWLEQWTQASSDSSCAA